MRIHTRTSLCCLIICIHAACWVAENAGIDPVYCPLFFFLFFFPSHEGHLKFCPKFFGPWNFHVFCFCFCFAVSHKEWPNSRPYYCSPELLKHFDNSPPRGWMLRSLDTFIFLEDTDSCYLVGNCVWLSGGMHVEE